MRSAFRLAWLSSIRQPARTVLGVLGVVAVGALLFDMLLLSRGLVLSFGSLLDRVGFDIRVLATEGTPFGGPPIEHATQAAAKIRGHPGIEAVLPVRIRDVEIMRPDRSHDDRDSAARAGRPKHTQFVGSEPQPRSMWTLIEGRDLPQASDVPTPLIVNRNVAAREHVSIGSALSLRADCGDESAAPPRAFTVIGIAEFPFDDVDGTSVAGRLDDLGQLCG